MGALSGIFAGAANWIGGFLGGGGATAGAGTGITGGLANVGTAVGGAAGTTTFVGQVANAAFQLALSTALSAAFQPNLGGAGGQSIKWRPDPNAGVPYVFGRAATAGSPVYKTVYGGEKARHLRIVNVLSVGPIEGIEETFFNDVSTSFNVNRSAVGYYNGVLWFDHKLGAATETAHDLSTSPFSPTPDTVWGTDHKLSGLASNQVVMRYAALKYATGPAAPLNVVLGPGAYDPREDSAVPGGSGSQDSADRTTWTFAGRDNPYLQAISWGLGIEDAGEIVLGPGMPLWGIDVPAFVEGAGVCETNGWAVTGVGYSTDAKLSVLEQLLRAGGGVPIPMGAKLSCRVQAPRVSLATLTGADVLGSPSFAGPPTMTERFNTVIPRYPEEDRGWEVIAGDPVSVAAFVTQDGRTRSKEIGYPFVPTKDQAAELARYDIWESRELGPWEFEVRARWRQLKPGDCFEFVEPSLGIPDPVLLMVRERTRNPVTGRVVLRCWTETDAKHADALGATGTLPTAGAADTTEPGIEPPDSGTWTATPGTAVGGGAEFPVVYIGGASDSVEAADLIVYYRLDGDTDWNEVSFPVGADRKAIPILAPVSDYEFEYGYRSVRGSVSETRTADAGGLVTTGDIIPMDDSITTPKIVDEAVTVAEQQTQIDGFGGAGDIEIAYRGAGLDVFTQVDEYVFDYDGEGSIQLEWVGKLDWQRNAATNVNFFVCLDETPEYSGGGYAYFQNIVNYQGNQNALTITVVLPINLALLSTGSHTLSIWAQTEENTANVPYIGVGASFKEFVSKK